MTGFIEDMLMRQEGLDDKDIADINAALPKIQQLDQSVEAEWPKISGIVAQVTPLVPLLLRIVGKVIAKQRSLT